MQTNYTKLKTNLRLCMNRLKLLEKKKTELALKARSDIAVFLEAGKPDRARIRVETIIREDYLVEAMELLEMYCDLLIARIGLIQQSKAIDEGLEEAISSLIWVAPLLQAEIPEFKVISDLLTHKYTKEYAEASRRDVHNTVNKKLKAKMDVKAPPKILIENYLVEIAKSHNVIFEADASVMMGPVPESINVASLIDMGDSMGIPLGGGPPDAGFNLPNVPPVVMLPYAHELLAPEGAAGGYMPHEGAVGGFMPHEGAIEGFLPPPAPAIPPATMTEKPSAPYQPPPTIPAPGEGVNPPRYDSVMRNDVRPPPPPVAAPRTSKTSPTFPDLPDVPQDSPTKKATEKSGDDEIDFDDLAARFEALKRKK